MQFQGFNPGNYSNFLGPEISARFLGAKLKMQNAKCKIKGGLN
jgi:hypothetical protein